MSTRARVPRPVRFASLTLLGPFLLLAAIVLPAPLAGLAAQPAAAAPSATVPEALAQMADTERAFARRAGEAGIRDAFIEYFADEAVGFEPGPVPARESLRRRPPSPVRLTLLWEPRSGDVGRSGDLGYLTGPSERSLPGRPPSFGTYFSVWKRMADGTFRVILDVGIDTPGPAAFAPGFQRAPAAARWSGSAAPAEDEASLLRADRAFADALPAGAAEAYRAVLHESGRLMRGGQQPFTTRDAATAWLAATVTAMTSAPEKAETAASGDLGYTWGRYTERRAATAEHGYYVRVWTRAADGSWRLALDVTTSAP